MAYRDDASSQLAALRARNAELEDALKRSMHDTDVAEAQLARYGADDEGVPLFAVIVAGALLIAVFCFGASLGFVIGSTSSRAEHVLLACKEPSK